MNGTDSPSELQATVYRAHLVRRNWFRRVIRVAGALDAVVDYNARGIGYETVRVNGQIAYRQFSGEWGANLVTPHLEFLIPSGHGSIPASIDVLSMSWLGLSTFRLTVDGIVIYQEGSERGHSFPVPAAAPPPAADTLPLPAAPSPPPAMTLPPASKPRADAPPAVPDVECRAVLRERSYLRRVFRLTGAVEGNLEWNALNARPSSALGCEHVMLNGKVLAEGQSLWIVPRFDFTLPSTHGPVPGHLEVRLWPWFQLGALQLTVAGKVVYQEGSVEMIRPSEGLPIPAAPQPASGSLPLPASSHPEDAAALPLPADMERNV